MSGPKPSKSARKRENQALQTLGERLIDLSPEQLAGMPLDERLLEAVQNAKNMKSHGALRRQKQFIGKLMRQVDPEPIRAALEELGREDKLARKLFRESELWRDRIVAERDNGLADFFDMIGAGNPDLEEQSRAYDTAKDEQARRLIRRRIFSEVHGQLAAKIQKSSR